MVLGNQTQDLMVAQQTLSLLPYSIALVDQGPDPQSGAFQVLTQMPAHPTTDHPVGCLSLTSFLPTCPPPTPCFLTNDQPVWYLEGGRWGQVWGWGRRIVVPSTCLHLPPIPEPSFKLSSGQGRAGSVKWLFRSPPCRALSRKLVSLPRLSCGFCSGECGVSQLLL